MNNSAQDGFNGKVEQFKSPTQLPNSAEAQQWQNANKQWWENSPMRYDWSSELSMSEGSPEYFAEIDRRFFNSSRHYLPWQKQPFDVLIDFPSLATKDVLEIGVGHGSHAALIAPHCRTFTGIDLTGRATTMTRKRLEQKQIKASIEQMDAENMCFPNVSFDFIWSWGVIHHSANTEKVVQEMARVLKPNGQAVVMVYFRSWWHYYIQQGLLHRLATRHRQESNHEIAQRFTDGAIARFYSVPEWQSLCADTFKLVKVQVTGLKTDVLPLPGGFFKEWCIEHVPDQVTRFMTDKLRMGSFLIVHMTRRT